MLTPQDLQEVGFQTAKFGGYAKPEVDAFLEPLMDDYVALYKENAVLKSKMRLLVERLEEYRAGEAEMKAAMENTQKTCDEMLADAKRRSAQMLQQAQTDAQSKTRDVDAAVQEEQERLVKAKNATADFIAAVEAQIGRQLRTLEVLKGLDLPKDRLNKAPRKAYDYESEMDPPAPSTEDIAAEIEQNVGKITGSIPNPDPTAATRIMPPIDLDKRTSEKFADLQFGRNYQP